MAQNSSFNTFADLETPRAIPIFLKFRLLFLGLLNLLGLMMMVFVFVLPILFSPDDNYKAFFELRDNDPRVTGVLTDIIQTNVKVNKRYLFKYSYNYAVNGKVYSGKCFGEEINRQPGDSIGIQYAVAHPALSVIPGMSNEKVPLFAIIMFCLFPVIGVVLFILGVISGTKKVALLVHGIATTGKFIRKEATSTSINKQRVYRLIFEFKTGTGEKVETCCGKTHKLERVLDEAEERLVYNANDPSKALLIDSLPKAVRKYFENN